MESYDSPTPQERAAAEVAATLLGMSLPALSAELRGFLSAVMELHRDTGRAIH